MTYLVAGRNVNVTYPLATAQLLRSGVYAGSRNGEVITIQSPVIVTNERPTERVLTCRRRDANPFFHTMEALWMLAGRNDPQWLDRYVRDFSARFAEPDGRMHGAYGYRWRHHWGFDQLEYVTRLLRKDPGDRRVVITMWDPVTDLDQPVRDAPCNVVALPRVVERDRGNPELDLTVCCRSNDLIWGMLGANVVHFSFLQEYLAVAIGVNVGQLHQVTTNLHAYVETANKHWPPEQRDPYADYDWAPAPVVTAPDVFLAEVETFVGDQLGAREYENGWLHATARQMELAHSYWREGRHVDALMTARHIASPDWRHACLEWLDRHERKQ